MPAHWNVSTLSFNVLLLLERVPLNRFPGWLPEADLALALCANPVVEWNPRRKCPPLNACLDGVMAKVPARRPASAADVRRAGKSVMISINDLLTYVVDPGGVCG
jgi:hypothetical protein